MISQFYQATVFTKLPCRLTPRATSTAVMVAPSRSLSFTDAQYAKLGTLAKAAKLSQREHIIDRLGLYE